MRESVRTFVSDPKKFYEILELGMDSTQAQVKQAFNKKVKTLHPDHKTGSSEAFRELLLAYNTLKDPSFRKDYDRGIFSECQDKSTNIYKYPASEAKFYQNRWYNFKRPREDIRNEEEITFSQSVNKTFEPISRRIMIFFFVFFLFETIFYLKRSKLKKQLKVSQEMFDLKGNYSVSDYILKRQAELNTSLSAFGLSPNE